MSLSLILDELLTRTDHRLIIEASPYWITVRTYTPANRWLIEVCCNKNLSKDNQLTSIQQSALEELGYKSRRQGYSRGKLLTTVSPEQTPTLAKEFSIIFEQILQCQSTPSHSVRPSPPIRIYNRELLAKMKESARSKEHSLRLQLYTLFIDSNFIALTDTDGTLLQCDRIQNLPCFGVFTDEKHALQFDPRANNLTILPAIEVIQRCILQGAGSLWIKPKGETRGELYKNELEGLWHRVRRFHQGD